MANWKHSIKISEHWQLCQNHEIAAQELCIRIIPLFKALPASYRAQDNGSYTLDELIRDMEDFSKDESFDNDDFDEIWTEVYDWADAFKLWIDIF